MLPEADRRMEGSDPYGGYLPWTMTCPVCGRLLEKTDPRFPFVCLCGWRQW